MSLLTGNETHLNNYIAAKLLEGGTVYVYRRVLASGVFEYIATSEDSDAPPRSRLHAIYTPTTSSLFDHTINIENNAPNQGMQGVFNYPISYLRDDS